MHRFLLPCLLAIFSACSFAQPTTPRQKQPQEVRITAQQLNQLRPVLEKDLAVLLKTVYNDPPTPADIQYEFLHCQFTPLHLGKLGPAILVEAQAGHGAQANAALLNIYLPEKNSYRRILEGAGFGPEIGMPLRPIPDLIFVWASGVCHAVYEHYRYNGKKYERDACDQQPGDAATGDTCGVKRCENSSLPTFPDPEAGADNPSAPAPPTEDYIVGTPRTGKEILNSK
jgi:hypothetical protein